MSVIRKRYVLLSVLVICGTCGAKRTVTLPTDVLEKGLVKNFETAIKDVNSEEKFNQAMKELEKIDEKDHVIIWHNIPDGDFTALFSKATLPYFKNWIDAKLKAGTEVPSLLWEVVDQLLLGVLSKDTAAELTELYCSRSYVRLSQLLGYLLKGLATHDTMVAQDLVEYGTTVLNKMLNRHFKPTYYDRFGGSREPFLPYNQGYVDGQDLAAFIASKALNKDILSEFIFQVSMPKGADAEKFRTVVTALVQTIIAADNSSLTWQNVSGMTPVHYALSLYADLLQSKEDIEEKEGKLAGLTIVIPLIMHDKKVAFKRFAGDADNKYNLTPTEFANQLGLGDLIKNWKESKLPDGAQTSTASSDQDLDKLTLVLMQLSTSTVIGDGGSAGGK